MLARIRKHRWHVRRAVGSPGGGGLLMLELRPNCELCDADLPPDALDARICSYECTFCAECVDRVVHDVWPNCGGGFVPRPIRPREAWRAGVGLAHDPPAGLRRHSPHSPEQIRAFTARLRTTPPSAR